jgi:AcrR family transcriptional regulator
MAVKKIKKSKEEKAQETRELLLNAAAKIVGKFGYANASVSRIVEEAGIAQGTFYLNFESRQTMFDELLPFIAMKALNHLRERSAEPKDFFAREEQSFRNFFDYLLTHPYYYRVLGEAETAAPAGFNNWFNFITERYAHSLIEAAGRGEIVGLTTRELQFMSVILLACRRYVYQQFVKTETRPSPLPEWVVQAYMKLIRRSLSLQDLPAGLLGPEASEASGQRRAAAGKQKKKKLSNFAAA